jgi:hypothetical protein
MPITSPQIHQRSPEFGIDRGIGLDKVVMGLLPDVSPLWRRSQEVTVLSTRKVADGHDHSTMSWSHRIADGRFVLGLIFIGDVGLCIASDDFGFALDHRPI